MLLTLLLMTTPAKGHLDLTQITENTGFVEIKLNQIDIVTNSDIIIHN